MLTELSQGDFQYLQRYASEMRKCHEREFMEEINPDLIRAFYRGRKVKDARFKRSSFSTNESDHLLMLSMIFGSANTILPNLYNQDSPPIIEALRGQSPTGISPEESAAMMTAIIKFYMKKNQAKIENQEAVLNAYHFGIGWKKVGYTKAQEPQAQIAEEPETQDVDPKKDFSFMSLMGMDEKKPLTPMQRGSRMEFDAEEGLFNSSESPLNVMLDHKSDLRNKKAILHRVPRTLYELMNFSGYEESIVNELYEKFRHVKGSRLDTRDVDLTLNELHIRQRNGIWICAWVDELDKPLQYDRSTWQGRGFQLIPLHFTHEPGVRYPISHMKIATQVQEKIDKMASLFYEQISRARNMLFINKLDLEKGTLDAIEQNKIQGIAITNKAISSGTFAHAQSPSVQNDLPTLIAMAQQNLTEIMGSDSQAVSGKSKNKTLGQDELARVGTQIRESGMQDRVKDFMVEQFEKEGQLIQDYCDAEMKLEILGEDYADPILAEKAQKQSVEFMTLNNPIAAKRYVEGVDYKYDFSVDDSIRPNREKIMNDIERVIAFTTTPVVENAINEDGFRVKTGALGREWLKQVESLGNPRKYLEPINSAQLAAIQTKKLLMGGGMNAMQPKPKEEVGVAGKTPKEPEPKSSEAANL